MEAGLKRELGEAQRIEGLSLACLERPRDVNALYVGKPEEELVSPLQLAVESDQVCAQGVDAFVCNCGRQVLARPFAEFRVHLCLSLVEGLSRPTHCADNLVPAEGFTDSSR